MAGSGPGASVGPCAAARCRNSWRRRLGNGLTGRRGPALQDRRGALHQGRGGRGSATLVAGGASQVLHSHHRQARQQSVAQWRLAGKGKRRSGPRRAGSAPPRSHGPGRGFAPKATGECLGPADTGLCTACRCPSRRLLPAPPSHRPSRVGARSSPRRRHCRRSPSPTATTSPPPRPNALSDASPSPTPSPTASPSPSVTPSSSPTAQTSFRLAPLPAALRARLGASKVAVPSTSFGSLPVSFSYVAADRLVAAAPYPPSYDLRSLDKLPTIADEGAHNACWAFAALDSLESCLYPAIPRLSRPTTCCLPRVSAAQATTVAATTCRRPPTWHAGRDR